MYLPLQSIDIRKKKMNLFNAFVTDVFAHAVFTGRKNGMQTRKIEIDNRNIDVYVSAYELESEKCSILRKNRGFGTARVSVCKRTSIVPAAYKNR